MGDMSEHIEWANPADGYENHIAGHCDKDSCRYCAEDKEDDEEYYGEENVK